MVVISSISEINSEIHMFWFSGGKKAKIKVNEVSSIMDSEISISPSPRLNKEFAFGLLNMINA